MDAKDRLIARTQWYHLLGIPHCGMCGRRGGDQVSERLSFLIGFTQVHLCRHCGESYVDNTALRPIASLAIECPPCRTIVAAAAPRQR